MNAPREKNEVFQSIIYHFLDISTHHILDNTFLILIFNMSSIRRKLTGS